MFPELMMLPTSSFKKKIFFYMAIAGLVPLLALAVQNHYFGKKAIEKLETEHLQFSLQSRMLWLREWLRHSKKEFNRLGSSLSGGDGNFSPEFIATFLDKGQNLFKGHASYRSLALYDRHWSLISQFPENPASPPQLPKEFKKKFTDDMLLVSSDQYETQGQNVILPLGLTLSDQSGQISGYLVAEMNMSKSLHRIMSDTADLDESGKLYLVTSDGSFLYHTSQSHNEKTICSRTSLPTSLLQGPYWQLQRRFDCQGVPVFSIAAHIPEMNWILITEIDEMDVLSEFQKYIWIGSTTALTILVLIVIIATRSASDLANPLDEFTQVAQHIAAGNYQERLPQFKDQYINDVAESFNTMLDALEESKKNLIQTISLSAVGKLSSSIVHEMRNPLSSVKINLQALARKVKDDPAYTEMAAIGLMQVKRLESMFTDLLHFSKPIQLDITEVPFIQLAEEVREILTQKAADKIISIELIDHLGDNKLKVDKKHFLLALMNLVDNAIQWSPAQSIVQVSGEELPDSSGFAILVRDSGPGLRDDQLDKLFQPFYTTREKGTGLGLANVKKIVEFHGGTVLADNTPQGGAQFSMIFKGRSC